MCFIFITLSGVVKIFSGPLLRATMKAVKRVLDNNYSIDARSAPACKSFQVEVIALIYDDHNKCIHYDWGGS